MNTLISASSPKTFSDLTKSRQWKLILRLLAKSGKVVTVAESEAMMGSYCALVLNAKGFQCESGKAGMTAAYTGTRTKQTPVRAVKRVLELALDYSAPLSDDPPGTPTPTEAEIVSKLLGKLEEIRKSVK